MSKSIIIPDFALILLMGVTGAGKSTFARRPLLSMAKEHRCPVIAVILDFPLELCVKRNDERPDRAVPRNKIAQQYRQLQRTIPILKKERFDKFTASQRFKKLTP